MLPVTWEVGPCRGASHFWALRPDPCRHVHPTSVHTRVVSALCVLVSSWKEPRCPTVGKCFLDCVGRCSAVTVRGLLGCPEAWMSTRRTTLSRKDGLEGCAVQDGSLMRLRVKQEKRTGWLLQGETVWVRQGSTGDLHGEGMVPMSCSIFIPRFPKMLLLGDPG